MARSRTPTTRTNGVKGTVAMAPPGSGGAWSSPARFALVVRVVVVVWSAAAAWLAGHPYDSSQSIMAAVTARRHGGVCHTPGSARCDDGVAALPAWERAIHAVGQPLSNWDGFYFHHIAATGYTAEQFHAFFPGLPWLMRVGGELVGAAFGGIGLKPLPYTCVLLAGLIITNGATVAAATVLHDLTFALFASPRLAYLSAIAFAISPAGVFMSATYTEGPFAAASFFGMLWCSRAWAAAPTSLPIAWGSMALATAAFTAASTLRSNGMLLCGYVWYTALVVWQQWRDRSQATMARMAMAWLVHAGVTLAATLCIVAPYVAFQWYGYFMYCAAPPAWVREWGAALGVFTPWAPRHSTQPWCMGVDVAHPWRPPNLYGHVQHRYWGVGLFQYYQAKQIPQFVLASPIVALAAVCAWNHIQPHAAARHVLYLLAAIVGVATSPAPAADTSTPPPPAISKAGTMVATPGHRHRRRPSIPTPTASTRAPMAIGNGGLSPWPLHTLPFVVHWLMMTVVAVIGMHVQVTTRFVAACPPLYWMIGAVLHASPPVRTIRAAFASLLHARGRWGTCDAATCLLIHSVGFTIIGTMLFANFYNWT